MKVNQLIDMLNQCPANAEVWLVCGNREGDWIEEIRKLEVTVVSKISSSSEEKIGDIILQSN